MPMPLIVTYSESSAPTASAVNLALAHRAAPGARARRLGGAADRAVVDDLGHDRIGSSSAMRLEAGASTWTRARSTEGLSSTRSAVKHTFAFAGSGPTRSSRPTATPQWVAVRTHSSVTKEPESRRSRPPRGPAPGSAASRSARRCRSTRGACAARPGRTRAGRRRRRSAGRRRGAGPRRWRRSGFGPASGAPPSSVRVVDLLQPPRASRRGEAGEGSGG